jgi:exosortase/archaeosortase family protein
MTIFIAISVAIVLLIERPWWDKLVILVSSIPIAILVNVIRITITGLLFMTPLADSERWSKLIAHDLPGYIMPIMAMGFMGLELWVLSKLMVPEDTRPTAGIGMVRRQGRQAPVPR